MDPNDPSRSAPLEYASPPPKPRSNILLIIVGILTSRTTRLIYLAVCAVGFGFVLWGVLRYRHMLEDAMNHK